MRATYDPKAMITLNLQAEEWRPVPGYNGDYEVSDLGRVRSYKRKKSILLRPLIRPSGHKAVVLCLEGKTKLLSVHRMVALCFINNPYNKKWVCHINGVAGDNRAVNLYWGSPRENTADMLRHAAERGKPLETSPLSTEQVLEIKDKLQLGIRQKELALKYGVSPSCICRIAAGNRWKWLS